MGINIQFNYLYRDGANYKQYHSEIFENKNDHSIEYVDQTIRANLVEGEWFYANKWQLKDMHSFAWDCNIDHEWHEYDCIELTDDVATIGDIDSFLRIINEVK